MWRDYMRLFCLSHGASSVFSETGPAGELPKGVWWERSEEKFSAWCQGKTGVPFLDAQMRELVVSGFMSNRGRQNVRYNRFTSL
jgi:deoxyribodipyrimidine photo-lyase